MTYSGSLDYFPESKSCVYDPTLSDIKYSRENLSKTFANLRKMQEVEVFSRIFSNVHYTIPQNNVTPAVSSMNINEI